MKLLSEKINLTEIIIFILTATIGIFTGFQQNKINEISDQFRNEIEKERIINLYVDQLTKNIDKLSIDSSNKRELTVLLLDIITEANLHGGETTEAKKESLPFRIALAAGAVEYLYQSPDTSKRSIWIGLAQKSESPFIKTTAINALTHIAQNTQEQKELKLCLNSILAISKDLSIHAITKDALKSVFLITSRIKNEDLLFRENDFRQELEKISALLLELGSNMDATNQEQIDTIKNLINSEDEKIKIASKEIPISIVAEEKVSDDSEILKYIGELTDDSTLVRRNARNMIALKGASHLTLLTKKLEEAQDYRAKLGIIYAISIMDKQENYSPQDIKRIVPFLGDSDASIRKYTAEILMSIKRPELKDAGLEQFKIEFKSLDNPNLVYNGIIILGNWLKQAPSPEKEKYQTTLTDLKTALEKDSLRWKRSINLNSEVMN